MPAPISARLLLFCYITSDLQVKGNKIIIMKEIKVIKENIRKLDSKLDNETCLVSFIYVFLPACFYLSFPASRYAFCPFLSLRNIDIDDTCCFRFAGNTGRG